MSVVTARAAADAIGTAGRGGAAPADWRAMPLLLALRPDGDAFGRWARDHGAAADWAWVVRRAEQHKVATLLAERLGAIELDRVVHRQLALTRLDAARRAEAAERTLARLAEVFGGAGVDFFVVKGSVLAHQVYGDARRRRFADVDVVVHRADVARAGRVLRALGYRPGGVVNIVGSPPRDAAERRLAVRLTRRFERRHLGAFSWRPPAGGELLSVDLHWQLSPDRLPRDADRLWEQTVPVTVAGVRLRTLAPAATVLHLAAHATTCLLNGFRLLHLVDVAWAARRHDDDAAAVWSLAERWRMTSHLARVFALLETRLGVPVRMAAEGPRRRAMVSPLISTAMLIDVPDLASVSPHRRLVPELRWAIGMRCLRRTLRISTATAATRVRLRRGSPGA